MSEFLDFNPLFDVYNIFRRAAKRTPVKAKNKFARIVEVPYYHHYLYPARGCPDVTEHWPEARLCVPVDWPHCLSAHKSSP